MLCDVTVIYVSYVNKLVGKGKVTEQLEIFVRDMYKQIANTAIAKSKERKSKNVYSRSKATASRKKKTFENKYP